jgi:N-acetylmuramoyl-L-alanine amidase
MSNRIVLILSLTSAAIVIASCQQPSAGLVIDDQQTSVQETISIYELSRLLGLRVSESKSTHVTLKDSANTVMIFTLSGSRVYVNAKPVGTVERVDRTAGPVHISRSLVSRIRSAMQTVAPTVRPLRLSGCIVIDAGHGGKDPGATSILGYHEKTVNLAVVHKVAHLLRRKGLRVEMTRKSDRFIELEERAAIANRLRADLFVSIHLDSSPKSSRRGSTMYIARSASPSSRRAASAIARSMANTGLTSHGTQTANYHVLVGTRGPAVLIELGYLSNRREAALLRDSAFQNRLAQAIADGISDFLG